MRNTPRLAALSRDRNRAELLTLYFVPPKLTSYIFLFFLFIFLIAKEQYETVFVDQLKDILYNDWSEAKVKEIFELYQEQIKNVKTVVLNNNTVVMYESEAPKRIVLFIEHTFMNRCV